MGFDGCYAECTVRKRKTKGSTVIKSLVMAMLVSSGFTCLLLFAGGASAGGLLMLLIAIACVVTMVVLFPRFDMEWEYVFVDGQLDLDMIFSGSSRKRKLRTDFEKLEVLAPSDSDKLAEFKNMQFVKVLDCTSLTGADNYTMIIREGNSLVKILFEPDMNMLELMKTKSPRKVFTK